MDEARRRSGTRRQAIVAATLLTIAFVISGGLSTGVAVAAILGLVAWAALWPVQPLPREEEPARPPTGAPSIDGGHDSVWPAVLDTVPDPALVLDREKRVIRANTAAQGDFPGADGRHITHVHRSPQLLAAVERAQSSKQPHTFDLHDPVPVERHYSGIAAPLPTVTNEAGEPALVVLLRDRTEAEHLAQMRADFVANASHELRTPLSSLKGFIETLQTTAKDDTGAREQFLGIMQEQATRMSRLIDDLLSLSRIEMREHVPPTGRVDLNVVAAETIAALGPVARAGQITLSLASDTDNALVPGDRDELMQVAQNLIQNAIKYGKRGGRVDVTVKREAGRLLLAVADDGIGIAPQHLPRLTERFYRVSAKDSRERGGTGLGLAIVKHIVNRHRGELRIESTPGQGSTFVATLPQAEK